MEHHKFTLSFLDKQKEKLFNSEYYNTSIYHFRIAFALVIALYGLFGYLDIQILPEHVNQFLFVRFIVVIPVFLIVLILSFTKFFFRIWQTCIFISFLIGGFGICYMTVQAPDNNSYFAGLMLVFFSGYFFVKLRFILASIASWIILMVYNIGAVFFSNTPMDSLLITNFFVISANIIGMFGAYNIELYIRHNFILSKNLENEKKLVEETNQNLEGTVLERTKEIQKAKEKAEESELTFRKLFEESADPILLIDGSGVFAECNQAALDILKMPREQFLLQTPKSTSPEFQPNGRRSEDLAIEMIEMAYKNGLNRFDWTHINSKGEEFIVEISLMPIIVRGQTMLHTTWREITERKLYEIELEKAKEKAEESEERFRHTIESSPIPTVIADNDGKLIYLNKQFIQTYGYTLEDIPTIEKWFELAYSDPKYRSFVFNDWGKEVEYSLKNDVPTRHKEYEVSCKNGDIKTVSVSAYFEKDISIRLFQNITEQKKAEKALLTKMDELERFHKITIGRELAMIQLKKEINNLLNKLGQENKYTIFE